MKVKLLRDVREGIQVNSLGVITNPGTLKVVKRADGRAIEFVEGAVIEMSEPSGRKYIDAGVAEEVTADHVE